MTRLTPLLLLAASLAAAQSPPCMADAFLDVSDSPGAGPEYARPRVEAACEGNELVVRSNGIPHYEFVQITPNPLLEVDYEVRLPARPAVNAAPTPIPLLGGIGVAVNGIVIFGPNEGPVPTEEQFGDPIYNSIMDACMGHTAREYHYHALVQRCLSQGVKDGQPSPVLGFAYDGIPIRGPWGCADAGCEEVVRYRSSWERVREPHQDAWDAYDHVERDDPEYLDACNGHTGPDGEYHYHATETWPYILGCYAGTPVARTGRGRRPPAVSEAGPGPGRGPGREAGRAGAPRRPRGGPGPPERGRGCDGGTDSRHELGECDQGPEGRTGQHKAAEHRCLRPDAAGRNGSAAGSAGAQAGTEAPAPEPSAAGRAGVLLPMRAERGRRRRMHADPGAQGRLLPAVRRQQVRLARTSLLAAGVLAAIAAWPQDPAPPRGDHSRHPVLDVPEGLPVPSVSVRVYPDAMDGFNVLLETTDFRFAPESVGQPAVANAGHAHLYVNGEKAARLYAPWHHLSGKLLRDGVNRLEVELSANDHSVWGAAGEPVGADLLIDTHDADGDPVVREEVRYTLDWDWGSALRHPAGGWTAQTDLGYSVHVTAGQLVTRNLELVPCHAVPVSPALASLLRWAAPREALAGHSSLVPNESKISRSFAEDLAAPQAAFLESRVVTDPEYCRGHYLVARPKGSPPGEFALAVEGTWTRAGVDGPATFRIESAGAYGKFLALSTESGTALDRRWIVGGLDLTLRRALATMFDGMEFDGGRTSELGSRAMRNLVRGAALVVGARGSEQASSERP